MTRYIVLRPGLSQPRIDLAFSVEQLKENSRDPSPTVCQPGLHSADPSGWGPTPRFHHHRSAQPPHRRSPATWVAPPPRSGPSLASSDSPLSPNFERHRGIFTIVRVTENFRSGQPRPVASASSAQSGVPRPHCLQTYSNFRMSLTLPAFTFTRIYALSDHVAGTLSSYSTRAVCVTRSTPLSFHGSQLSALALGTGTGTIAV
jgi:hypothetical protein